MSECVGFSECKSRVLFEKWLNARQESISPFIAVERHDASSREMGDKRKLQAEIDRTLKKIDEGVDVYDRIYQKVVDAESQSNKEKYEVRALSCPRDAPAPVPAPRVMLPRPGVPSRVHAARWTASGWRILRQ